MITTKYIKIMNDFISWLERLNYSVSTIDGSPRKVRDFLSWLEINKIHDISNITTYDIQIFFDYLQLRPNKRRSSGGLSNNYIYAYYVAIRLFSKYLLHNQQIVLKVEVMLPIEPTDKIILTKDEIKLMFDATSDDVLGLRDKAMLAVYYSCGLRRSEGLALNIDDVDLQNNRILIRDGKGNKQRYVPFNQHTTNIISNYMQHSRPELESFRNEAFFLSERGGRITGNAMDQRLKKLVLASGISKEISLHSLRHSIASHLLQNGLELNRIKVFLGHNSLESTQIYTHIANETF